MLNSLILMFSQYEKNCTLSNVFKIIWIGYVFVGQLLGNKLPSS